MEKLGGPGLHLSTVRRNIRRDREEARQARIEEKELKRARERARLELIHGSGLGGDAAGLVKAVGKATDEELVRFLITGNTGP